MCIRLHLDLDIRSSFFSALVGCYSVLSAEAIYSYWINIYLCIPLLMTSQKENKLLKEVHQCKVPQVVSPVFQVAAWEFINLSIISSFLTAFSFSLWPNFLERDFFLAQLRMLKDIVSYWWRKCKAVFGVIVP